VEKVAVLLMLIQNLVKKVVIMKKIEIAS